MHKRARGVTLVELMVVVALLGFLVGVAAPKFGNMLRTSKEGDVKSKLGIMRASLNIYFSDNLARFPKGSAGADSTLLNSCLVPKYLNKMVECYVYPHHSKQTTVDNTSNVNYYVADPSCEGEWVYVSDENNTNWGMLAVECYHSDSKGRHWTTY